MKCDEIVSKATRAKAPEIDHVLNGASKPSSSGPIAAVLKRLDGRTRISIRMLQAAFVVVIIRLNLRCRIYCAVHEGVSMVCYLQRARKRMRVFTARSRLALPAWLLIGVALCLFLLAAEDRFEVPEIIPIASLQLVPVLLVVIGFRVEYLIWRREHRPALGQIDHLLAELLEARPEQCGTALGCVEPGSSSPGKRLRLSSLGRRSAIPRRGRKGAHDFIGDLQDGR